MSELLTWSGGKAILQGIAIEDLAVEFGTPLYLYDRTVLTAQFERLRQALPREIEIYYSIKANPHPRIINIFVELGAGCEIASGGEYVLARRGRAHSEQVVFAGPGKGREELEFVISEGIGEIHLESFEEIEIIQQIAERTRKSITVSVRVNPSSASGGGLLMGGQATAFGFEEEGLDRVLDVLSRCAGLKLKGIHVYTGTQILNAEILLRHWEHAVDIAKKLADITRQPVSTIDLGGGLGIPYFAHEKELDLEVLGAGAEALVSKAHADPRLSGARFVVEPGRFLAGPAGLYVARVRSVKTSRGTTFVVLDGGMNHHLSASGNLGQVVRRDYPIVNLSRQGPVSESPLVVVGPLCTPIDTLGRKVFMPVPTAGDLIGILQSGAYGLTASPSKFLSHATPAEVMVAQAKCELISPRENRFESGGQAGRATV